VRRRNRAEEFRVTGVVERLTPYEAARVDLPEDELAEQPELVERAATLLAVMPRNQLRSTIERLLSPNDLEKGRRAIDALIDAAFAIEDETGHIRRVG
jgi:Lon protease-like protein